MSPIQWPRYLSEASLATSSLEVRKTAMTAGRRDRLQGSRHVDEVLLCTLPGMIRPRTGIREGVELGVQGDQSNDFVAGAIVEFLEGDLADDPVPEITPCPSRRRRRDEGHG